MRNAVPFSGTWYVDCRTMFSVQCEDIAGALIELIMWQWNTVARQQRHELDSHWKREKGGLRGWYKKIVHNWANKPQFMLVTHPPCKNGRRQKLDCSIYGCDVNIGLVFSVQPGDKIELHLTQSTNAAINRYLIHAKRTNWNHFQWMVGWLEYSKGIWISSHANFNNSHSG